MSGRSVRGGTAGQGDGLASRAYGWLGAALAVSGLMALPASAGATERMYALGSSNSLLSFRSNDPDDARVGRITGLPSGEVLVGLDRRPATGQLYAQGIRNRIYLVSPSSARATALGPAPFSPGLSGTSFGFYFNPVVDRIRLVSNAEQNLRLNQLTSTLLAVDGRLDLRARRPRRSHQPGHRRNGPVGRRFGLHQLTSGPGGHELRHHRLRGRLCRAAA